MYYNRITDLGGRNEIGLKSRYIYLTSVKEKDFVFFEFVYTFAHNL